MRGRRSAPSAPSLAVLNHIPALPAADRETHNSPSRLLGQQNSCPFPGVVPPPLRDIPRHDPTLKCWSALVCSICSAGQATTMEGAAHGNGMAQPATTGTERHHVKAIDVGKLNLIIPSLVQDDIRNSSDRVSTPLQALYPSNVAAPPADQHPRQHQHATRAPRTNHAPLAVPTLLRT